MGFKRHIYNKAYNAKTTFFVYITKHRKVLRSLFGGEKTFSTGARNNKVRGSCRETSCIFASGID